MISCKKDYTMTVTGGAVFSISSGPNPMLQTGPPNPGNPFIAPQGGLTVVAKAIPALGGIIPTGTMTLFDGVTSLVTQALVPNGILHLSSTTFSQFSAFNINTLSPGSHTLTCHYSGDVNYPPIVTNAITQLYLIPPGAIMMDAAAAAVFAEWTTAIGEGLFHPEGLMAFKGASWAQDAFGGPLFGSLLWIAQLAGFPGSVLYFSSHGNIDYSTYLAVYEQASVVPPNSNSPGNPTGVWHLVSATGAQPTGTPPPATVTVSWADGTQPP